MIALVRAGILAALVALLSIPLSVSASAQKAFQRDDLAEVFGGIYTLSRPRPPLAAAVPEPPAPAATPPAAIAG